MATMTTMLRCKTRTLPLGKASKGPRRAEPAREARIKVNAARTQVLGLESGLRTRVATTKKS